ncbi:MAG: hypothetical protein ACREGC_03140, partial [Minisyncoccia bacterium]
QKRFIQVMLPSLASSLIIVGISLTGFAIATFYYLSGNGAIYNFLFGPDSSAELISQSRGSFDAITSTIFGNPLLNKILYFAFWMIVGLLVYFMLYVIIKGAATAAEDIEEAKYKNAQPNKLVQGIITRLAVRAILVVAWMIYCVLFIKTLLPFSVLSMKIGVVNFTSPDGWFYTIIALFVLVTSLHLHVIFMRLITLKVRLIDSADVVD